jgi:hypothetical protein
MSYRLLISAAVGPEIQRWPTGTNLLKKAVKQSEIVAPQCELIWALALRFLDKTLKRLASGDLSCVT